MLDVIMIWTLASIAAVACCLAWWRHYRVCWWEWDHWVYAWKWEVEEPEEPVLIPISAAGWYLEQPLYCDECGSKLRNDESCPMGHQ